MSDMTFKCPHCEQFLSAQSKLIGSEVDCPLCSARFVVSNTSTTDAELLAVSSHETAGTCAYCRSEIKPSERVRICPACGMPHHEDCWAENKGCTVFGCAQAPSDEDKITIDSSVVSHRSQTSGTHPQPLHGSAMFLYIPVARFVTLSIISLGLYEVYWIYRNWRYLEKRDSLDIMPFWRAFFSIFHCHSLLTAIHSDRQANAIEKASFSAGGLATGWVILIILGNLLSRSDDPSVNLIGTLVSFPSFLFFIPVQRYVNRVNQKMSPLPLYTSWSFGQIAFAVVGAMFWLIMLATVAA